MEKHIPEGYKQTEVGVIPVDWQVKKIEEIALVKSGKRLPLGNTLIGNANSHPYIRVADMYMGGIDAKNIMYVPDDIFPKIENYRIFIDDIFISVAGTLGLVGRIPDELDGANLTENADKLTEIKCNQEYLTYLLMSLPIQKTIQNSKTLGAQPKLALARIRNFLIPIPPTINEQKSIATTLSDIDNLISSLEQLIEKKKAIKQGTMQELLTGRRRLKGFGEGKGYKQTELGMIPEDWEVKGLNRVVNFHRENVIPFSQPDRYFLLYSIPAFDDIHLPIKVLGREVRSNKFKVLQDAILLSKLNPRIPRIWMPKDITSNSIASTEFVIMTPNRNVNREFIFYVLKSEYFSRKMEQATTGTTGSHQRINPNDISEIRIILPTNTSEQRFIASTLAEMDSEIEKIEFQTDKYKQIKQGMMQNLLTGRIRLV